MWKITYVYQYVCIASKSKIDNNSKDTQREQNRWTIKCSRLYHTFFVLKGAGWKKQDHSLQCSVWVQNKNMSFNFDTVLKSVVGMQ
jgi:hypothetical protein